MVLQTKDVGTVNKNSKKRAETSDSHFSEPPLTRPPRFKPGTMHIPQDVVDLIIDQLSPPTDDREWKCHLLAASLVSTAWVNRCQHHLFSTLEFYRRREIERWCSKIKPDPCGISRHVRVLTIGSREMSNISSPRLLVSDIKAALPHLASFKNLKEFILGYTDLKDTSLDVFAPIFSSSADTLKRLQWVHWQADIQECWKAISTLAGLLPALTHFNLSGYRDECSEVQIRLSADEARSLAIRSLRFQELQIIYDIPHSLPFFESCGPHLQILDLGVFQMGEPLLC